MARNDDRDRVAAVGQPHGTCRARGTDLFGDLAVRPGFPIRDCQQRLPDPALKFAAPQIELNLEVDELAGEIGVQLLDGGAESPRIE